MPRAFLRRLFSFTQYRGRKRPGRLSFRPVLERLEDRLVPYALSGYQWANVNVSASFMPDGTTTDFGLPSALFATLNTVAPTATWQREFARALQSWADVTPLNFHFVSDNGAGDFTPGSAQGDSRFGDIRLGGYATSSFVGEGYYPSIGTDGGNVFLNTTLAWHIGTQTDIYSILLHESGHAIGMAHSSVWPAVMVPTNSGVYTGLYADDIAGIQAIYGARQADAYDAAAANDGLTSATTASLDGTGAVTISADLTTLADVDYYRVTAPTGSNGTLTVSVDARNLSLLTPKVSVYGSAGNLLGTVSATTYGSVATLTLTGLSGGQTYYLVADGATSDVFGMGAYNLQAQFSGFSSSALPSLAINNLSLAEGNSGTQLATFTVSLSAPSTSTVTVQYASANGTATAGTDYLAASGTLTFAPGEIQKTVAVTVNGDTTLEPDETFFVNLSAPANAVLGVSQGQGTIQNDDSAPTLPSLAINNVSQLEGNSGTSLFTFSVTLSAASTNTVTVQYTTANGTATAGSDYLATGGTLTFAPGETQKTAAVTVSGDTTLEPDESFFVSLTNPTNATLSVSQGTGTILNDDIATSPPSIIAPASATPNPVTGTSTNLSALATDAAGDATLTYTWTVTSAPAGAASPSFSANGSNAAQNSTATFHAAGGYTFLVAVTDPAGLTVTSSVAVTVSQTLTSLTLSPASSNLAAGTNQQFTAAAKDQFGNPLSTPPALSWSLTGIGALGGSGQYAAPNSTGSASVHASGGGLTSTASVAVVPAAPTNVTTTTVSSRQINLSWQESTTGITGFIIQRSTNGSSWSRLATVGATVTTYADKSVTKSKRYDYRVCATSSMGNSAWSTNGAAPAVDLVSGANLVVDGPADTSPSIAWPANADATNYDLWVDNLSTGQDQVIRQPNLTSNCFAPASPLPVGSYMAWVRAFNGKTPLGGWSAGLKFTIFAPAAPTLNGPANGTNTTPTFTWTASDGATQYDIWANNLTTGRSQVVRQTVATTSFIPANPIPRGLYVYWVRAGNSAGAFGVWSASYTFLIDTTAPAIPTITGPSSPTPILTPTITWSASTGAAYCDLWVDNLTTHQAQVIRQQNLTSNSFTPANYVAVGSYVAWVQAFDSTNQTRGWSAAYHFVVTPPATPSQLGPTGPTTNAIPTFSWGAGLGAIGYDLWVDNVTTGQSQVIRQQSLTTNSFTPVTALAKGAYRFWVRAVNGNGNAGAWSGAVDFTIG